MALRTIVETRFGGSLGTVLPSLMRQDNQQRRKTMQVNIEIHSAYSAQMTELLIMMAQALNEVPERLQNVADAMLKSLNAQIESDGEFHYFVSSGLHWHVGVDLLEVLGRQKRKDTNKRSTYQAKGCTVYRVPVSIDEDYQIMNYVPQVDGVTTVGRIDYSRKAGDSGMKKAS